MLPIQRAAAGSPGAVLPQNAVLFLRQGAFGLTR
jgi:hypothetical protein